MKIDKFDSRPAFNNAADGYKALYLFWMRTAAGHSQLLKINSSPKYAQSILGEQDYCWNCSRRYYIWERQYEFGHWRLFVSTRGFSLEFEENDSDDLQMKELRANKAIDSFVSHWNKQKALFLIRDRKKRLDK